MPVFKRIDKLLAPYAFPFLLAAGTVNVWMFALIVRYAGLDVYASRPLLSLKTILNGDRTAAWTMMAYFIILTFSYGIGWWAVRKLHGPAVWATVVIVALFSGFVLLFVYPYAAADIYDYIGHARISGIYGANPFAQVINNYPNDPFYAYAYWKTDPSTYGPAWELVAAPVARLAGNGIIATTIAFKLLAGGFMLLTLAALGGFLSHVARERALTTVLLLAWNPIVLFESFGMGHNDFAMVLWLVLAAWAIAKKRYTLSILALVAGILFKFIPLLLLPAAGLIALRSLPDARRRWRFVILSGISSLALFVLVYLPFWNGWATFTIGQRAGLYTTSLPAIIFFILQPSVGTALTGSILSSLALFVTVSFAIWQGWIAAREPSWESFARSAYTILMFYLLLTCTWFQVWYPIWPLVAALMLPTGLPLDLALFFSLAMLPKQYVLFPILYWGNTLPTTRLLREIYLSLGNLGPTWLAAVWVSLRTHSWFGNKPVRKASEEIEDSGVLVAH